MQVKVQFRGTSVALAVLRASLRSSPLLQLFLVREIYSVEQIAMLNLSSAFESVIAEQSHIYTNT